MSLTVQKKHPQVSEAISALLVQQPFFASLMLDLIQIEEANTLPDGAQLDVIATDGRTMWINPDKFGKYSTQERVGMLAHEIMHVILQHAARQTAYLQLGVGPDLKAFSRKKFNHAADYIINAHLTSQGFKLPLGSLQNSQVTGDDIIDEVYLKLPDDEEDEPDGPDQHPEGMAGQQCATPVMQAALKKAQEIAKMQGKGTAGMDRVIDNICTPKISWQEHLRKSMINQTRGRDVYSWSKPNKRKLAMPPGAYWPGRAGLKGPEIAVEIDTSGSIGEHELKTFLGELSGILTDIEPSMIHVMYVDSELHGDVIEIDDVNELGNLGAKAGGGGGTDMTKVFEIIQERQMEVENVVVFTDGYTPFGDDTGIPTIWAITTPDIKAPWGTTVHVEIADKLE